MTGPLEAERTTHERSKAQPLTLRTGAQCVEFGRTQLHGDGDRSRLTSFRGTASAIADAAVCGLLLSWHSFSCALIGAREKPSEEGPSTRRLAEVRKHRGEGLELEPLAGRRLVPETEPVRVAIAEAAVDDLPLSVRLRVDSEHRAVGLVRDGLEVGRVDVQHHEQSIATPLDSVKPISRQSYNRIQDRALGVAA